MIEVVDRILVGEDGRVAYHFVVVDYLCRPRGGILSAGSDVEAVVAADPAALDSYDLTDAVKRVIARAMARVGSAPSSLPHCPIAPLVQFGQHRRAMLSRDHAWALVTEHVQSESLRKHLLGVDAAVRGYARMFGEDEHAWGFVALVHDLDYEKYPDKENHPFRCVEWLTTAGYPAWVTRAILSHADYSGVARESRLEKVLYACDELSGFVAAAALVRPSKSVLDLEPSSVMKRLKDKAFARNVSRDDIRRGAEDLGIPLEEHISNVIGFMRERAEALGLKGSL